MMTSDDFLNLISHMMTFYDQVMTFVMNGEDLWMTLSTLSDNLLTTLTTTGGDLLLLTARMTTGEELLSTCDDDTDDHYDNTDI
jgi:hypothetical protein